MLEFNLGKLNKIITIKSTDSDFKDTELFNTGFEVDVKPLSRTDKSTIVNIMQTNDNFSAMEYSKEVALFSIEGIRGIKFIDQNGNMAQDLKIQIDALFDMAPDLLFNRISQVADSLNKLEEQKKSEN